jgi:hypothetical protein
MFDVIVAIATAVRSTILKIPNSLYSYFVVKVRYSLFLNKYNYPGIHIQIHNL